MFHRKNASPCAGHFLLGWVMGLGNGVRLDYRGITEVMGSGSISLAAVVVTVMGSDLIIAV